MRNGIAFLTVTLTAVFSPVNADSGKGFDTVDAAARSVLTLANPVSISQNIELGGYLFRTPDGKYRSTTRLQGDHGRINFPHPAKLVPPGGKAIATWHTHGAATPGVVSETFSPQDIMLNQKYAIDGYLATPSGQVKHYRLNNPEIRKLGRLPDCSWQRGEHHADVC